MVFKNIGVSLGVHSIKISGMKDGQMKSLNYLIKYDSSKEYISEIKRTIKDFSKQIGERWLSLAFTVSEKVPFIDSSILIGEFSILNIDKKLADKGILNELQGKTEEDLKKYTTKIVKSVVDDQYEGVAYSMPKKAIETLEDVGRVTWKVDRIEYLPNSITNLIEQDDEYIILNLDVDDISLSYVRDGLIRSVTQIDKELEILDTDEDMEVKEDIYKSLKLSEDEVSEIVSSVRDIEINNSALTLNNIYITGDLSSSTEIEELISERTSIKAQIVESISEESLESNLDLFTGSLGVLKSGSDINFGRQRKTSINLSSVVITIVSGLIILNSGAYIINNKYEKLIDRVSYDLSIVKTAEDDINNTIHQLDIEMEDNIKKMNEIDEIKRRKIFLSDILYMLPTETPHNIRITNIESKEGVSVIRGFSEDYRAVAYLAMTLEQYGETNIGELDLNSEDIRAGKLKLEKEFVINLNHKGNRLLKE